MREDESGRKVFMREKEGSFTHDARECRRVREKKEEAEREGVGKERKNLPLLLLTCARAREGDQGGEEEEGMHMCFSSQWKQFLSREEREKGSRRGDGEAPLLPLMRACTCGERRMRCA